MNRSLISVEPTYADGQPGLILACDCGAVTHLVLLDLDQAGSGVEFAVTCDGCQSAHWMTARTEGAETL